MKKDIEWLVQMINAERETLRQRIETGRGTPNENTFNEGRDRAFAYVLRMIQHLDKPEVLTQELPAIPKYVADWIEQARKFHSISWLLNYRNIVDYSHELTLWCFESGNDDNLHKLARAWMDGYKVEEVPLYHALIKGHELADGYDIYWNYDKFDDSVFVSRLHPSHDNFLTEMSKSEWNKLGINDSNADFVKVEG